MSDYDDELRRDAIREDKIDAWWERWGCDECDSRGRVLCDCNFAEVNGDSGCDECDGTGYVDCEECEGKGHHFTGRHLP